MHARNGRSSVEEQNRTAMVDRQIADRIDRQQRRVCEDGKPAGQRTGGLSFFAGCDQMDQSRVAGPSASLGHGNCHADRCREEPTGRCGTCSLRDAGAR
jgi:hypothetical protein